MRSIPLASYRRRLQRWQCQQWRRSRTRGRDGGGVGSGRLAGVGLGHQAKIVLDRPQDTRKDSADPNRLGLGFEFAPQDVNSSSGMPRSFRMRLASCSNSCCCGGVWCAFAFAFVCVARRGVAWCGAVWCRGPGVFGVDTHYSATTHTLCLANSGPTWSLASSTAAATASSAPFDLDRGFSTPPSSGSSDLSGRGFGPPCRGREPHPPCARMCQAVSSVHLQTAWSTQERLYL